MRQETVLNVFPSSDDNQRLVVVVEQLPGEDSRLVLRQESFSEAIGWFVQSRVAIEPGQVAGLKMALGTTNPHPITPPRREKPVDMPEILRFRRAVAG